VGGRIVAVDPAAEHSDGKATSIECAAVGLAVDSSREAADHDQPGPSELASKHARDLRAIGRASPRADNRHRRPAKNVCVTGPTEKERSRRVVDLSEQLRQVTPPEPAHRRDRKSGRAHAAAASSFGVRNESASARCSGSISAAPARAATVAETRATRARPLADNGSR